MHKNGSHLPSLSICWYVSSITLKSRRQLIWGLGFPPVAKHISVNSEPSLKGPISPSSFVCCLCGVTILISSGKAMTLKAIIVFTVRPRLKSTRHLYSPSSSCLTGSSCNWAGFTFILKLARSNLVALGWDLEKRGRWAIWLVSMEFVGKLKRTEVR